MTYVSRGGLKLEAAIEAFGLDVQRFVCADLGCNVGGFVDCLLQRGAAHVYALDTGYGALAWKLRNDDRVTVLERTNALHFDPATIRRADASPPPADVGAAASQATTDPPRPTVDLVTIDLAWTPQRHAIPAALRWSPRWIISLLKPHYEAPDATRKRGGALTDDEADSVAERTLASMPGLGVDVVGQIRSPIRGGKSKGKAGNTEYLALLQPRDTDDAPAPSRP